MFKSALIKEILKIPSGKGDILEYRVTVAVSDTINTQPRTTELVINQADVVESLKNNPKSSEGETLLSLIKQALNKDYWAWVKNNKIDLGVVALTNQEDIVEELGTNIITSL